MWRPFLWYRAPWCHVSSSRSNMAIPWMNLLVFGALLLRPATSLSCWSSNDPASKMEQRFYLHVCVWNGYVLRSSAIIFSLQLWTRLASSTVAPENDFSCFVSPISPTRPSSPPTWTLTEWKTSFFRAWYAAKKRALCLPWYITKRPSKPKWLTWPGTTQLATSANCGRMTETRNICVRRSYSSDVSNPGVIFPPVQNVHYSVHVLNVLDTSWNFQWIRNRWRTSGASPTVWRAWTVLGRFLRAWFSGQCTKLVTGSTTTPVPCKCSSMLKCCGFFLIWWF